MTRHTSTTTPLTPGRARCTGTPLPALTITPLDGTVPLRDVLPNTDPASGVVTVTARPTRHAWGMGQAILAAMGVRNDLRGNGRNHGEDLEILTAWLHAHRVRMLVIRQADMLATHVLNDLLHILTALGADLALTVDDTATGGIYDWVELRCGTINHDPARLHAALALHTRNAPEPHAAPSRSTGRTAIDAVRGTSETASQASDDFPRVLPSADFYLFRARCRDLLAADEFAVIDQHYRHTFAAVARKPFADAAEASEQLAVMTAHSDNPGFALVTARAAQAAMFTHATLMKVHLPFFRSAVEAGHHRRLTDDELRSCYRDPWRGAAVALYDADLSPTDISALAMRDITDTGDLTDHAPEHLPLSHHARLYLRALKHLRRTRGSPPSSPFFAQRSRDIAEGVRHAAVELNLPMRVPHQTERGRKTDRWQHGLGVTLLPLTGPSHAALRGNLPHQETA